jgi:hypothetical protein
MEKDKMSINGEVHKSFRSNLIVELATKLKKLEGKFSNKSKRAQWQSEEVKFWENTWQTMYLILTFLKLTNTLIENDNPIGPPTVQIKSLMKPLLQSEDIELSDLDNPDERILIYLLNDIDSRIVQLMPRLLKNYYTKDCAINHINEFDFQYLVGCIIEKKECENCGTLPLDETQTEITRNILKKLDEVSKVEVEKRNQILKKVFRLFLKCENQPDQVIDTDLFIFNQIFGSTNKQRNKLSDTINPLQSWYNYYRTFNLLVQIFLELCQANLDFKPKKSAVILIAGDVVIDWRLARKRKAISGGSAFTGEIYGHWEYGGAIMLHDLIKKILKLQPDYQNNFPRIIRSPSSPSKNYSKDYPCFYSIWEERPYYTGSADKNKDKKEKAEKAEKKDKVWRIEKGLAIELNNQEFKTINIDPCPNIVVLSDEGLGFRDNKKAWGKLLEKIVKLDKVDRPWILLKISHPLYPKLISTFLNELFKKKLGDKLIIVLSVKDLRTQNVKVSYKLSWERTIRELIQALKEKDLLKLTQSAYLVFLFSSAGALLRVNKGIEKNEKYELLFDPAVMEDSWEQDYPGSISGVATTITASIGANLVKSDKQKLPNIASEIRNGIKAGLCGARLLQKEGYDDKFTDNAQQRGQLKRKSVKEQKSEDGARKKYLLVFPGETIAKEIVDYKNSSEFDKFINISIPSKISTSWTFLENEPKEEIEEIAKNIVCHGDGALKNIPIGKFGDLVVVGNKEIEDFRSIQTLIAEYCNRVQQNQPLSIAVFGPPGSGKSFGISQVARSLDNLLQIVERTFNLSQFTDPENLKGAFHQVRDISLSGKMPLVFWDEFDTSLNKIHLGWLRYFLTPMQDGKFLEGQITHPIGRSIFVFAGGTHNTMEQFNKLKPDNKDKKKKENMKAYEQFSKVKGPDFVSRLKGYINIVGLGSSSGSSSGSKSKSNSNSNSDRSYKIRRAILLRSLLSRYAPHFFSRQSNDFIDKGILQAFLNTSEYKHGVRSMESIIAMSVLSSKSRYEQSSLPSETQLSLHVDADDFLKCVKETG